MYKIYLVPRLAYEWSKRIKQTDDNSGTDRERASVVTWWSPIELCRMQMIDRRYGISSYFVADRRKKYN